MTGRNNYVASGTAEPEHEQHGPPPRPQFRRERRGGSRAIRTAAWKAAPLQAFPDDLAIAEGRVIEENHVHNFVAEYNQTLEPIDADDGAARLRAHAVRVQQPGARLPPSSLGLPASIDAAVDRMMFPAFGATNYVSLGGNDHRYNAFMSYPLLVSLTKTASRHTLKTGVGRRG